MGVGPRKLGTSKGGPKNNVLIDPRLQSNSTDATAVSLNVIAPYLANRSEHQVILDESTQPQISQYVAPDSRQYVLNKLANPFATLGYLVRGETVPGMLNNEDKQNVFDYAADVINPAAWINYALEAEQDLKQGNIAGAGANIIAAIPSIPAGSAGTKIAGKAIQEGVEKGGAKVVQSLNKVQKPINRFKGGKPGHYYRQVGQEGYDDALQQGAIYSSGQREFLQRNPGFSYADDYAENLNTGFTGAFNLNKPVTAPFFKESDLFFPANFKKGSGKTAKSDTEFMFASRKPNAQEALIPKYRDAYDPVLEPGGTGVLRPEFNQLSNFTLYTQGADGQYYRMLGDEILQFFKAQ